MRVAASGLGAQSLSSHSTAPSKPGRCSDRITARPGDPVMYATNTEQQVETRVRELAPLVKRIAYHMMTSLPPSVELDDVIQSGMMGLLDAARRYEVSEGAQFETYAVQRIRGAILDELRQCDWLPRGVRRSLREAEKMISKLEQKNGRPPTEAELAKAMDMSLAD